MSYDMLEPEETRALELRDKKKAALTLYQIETKLLDLLVLRDEVADEVRVTSEGKTEQASQLVEIDCQIAAYLSSEVVKVDNIAGLIRECRQRAETLWMEEKRIAILRKRWQAREERVKSGAAEVMAMQVDPSDIVAANQGKVLRRLTGKSSELKLCKSPPSVEVTDASLLPDEMQTATVSMTLQDWRLVALALNAEWIVRHVASSDVKPDLRAIGAVLKSQVPCEKCKGAGYLGYGLGDCDLCGGSGTQRGSVPGARLVEDSVHLRLG